MNGARKALAVAAGIGAAAGGAVVAFLLATGATSSTSCQANAEALLANRIVAPSQSYAKDNPGEYALVRAYLEGGARPATTGMTHMGLHLVYTEDLCRDAQPPPTTTTTTTTTPPPPPPDTTPPAKPILIGPSQTTQTSIQFSWQAGTDNVGVDHYNVFKGNSANVADQVKVAETTALSYTYTGLICGTDYSFALEVEDAAGNKSVLEQAIWYPARTSDCTGPPPPPGNLFITPTGSDTAACTQAAPCKTWNRAYQLAQCGQAVSVAAGNYPDQFLVERGICASPITIQASGAAPYVPIIWFGTCQGCPSSNSPDDLILRGMHTDGIIMWGDANNVVLDAIDGGSFFIKNATNVTVKNGDWGPCASNAAPSHTPGVDTCQGYSGIQQSRIISADVGVTNNILLENNVFHDHPAYDPDHWECLWTNGGTNVTWRGNRIYNCQNSASIFFNGTFAQGCRGSDTGGPGGTWLFENNWFGKESNGSALGIGSVALDPSCSLVVRFNSFALGEGIMNQGIPQTATTGTIRVVGNIIGARTCIAGVTYLYNVYTSGTCGTGGVAVSPLPYVDGSNGATGNYHLGVTSAADNLVPTNVADSALTIDFDGQARPQGSARDAGSDER